MPADTVLLIIITWRIIYERISKKILNYKKTAFWIIIATVATFAIVIFLTKSKTSDISNGLTPFYSISAHSAKLGAFRIAGFDLDGNNTAFLHKGKCYVINDDIMADTKIVGNATPPPTDLATLRKKYPQYFDLATFKGLEVYVWQMSKDSYYCDILPGTNREKDEEDFRKLKGITIPEMKAILSSYDIPKSDIFIIPINYAYSSYMYKIDEEYTKKVQAMFDED